MKTKSIFIALSVILVCFTSCDYDRIKADGEITSLEYSIPSYSELKVSNAFDAYVTFSDTEESILIEANDNLHKRIVVQREGNALVIGLKKFTNIRGNATLNVFIVTNDLAKFDLSGASTVTLENEWATSDGRIELSGASNFQGEIVVDRLRLDMSGASNLDSYGSVSALDANLSGSSDIRDYDLSVERLNIDMTGASEAFMSVSESIDIEARGASVLNYKGTAVIERKRLSGASEIKNRN